MHQIFLACGHRFGLGFVTSVRNRPQKFAVVDHALYDVKFYPYLAAGEDPVFAVTGGAQTFVCRAIYQKDNAIEILRWFKDDNADVQLNSLAWTKSLKNEPLVCVSGDDARIKIYNVQTGELPRVLVGHGSLVNDLAVSPTSPTILASASADHSIRIWDLKRRSAKNPCAGYHENGRYLLSGGLDTVVNMWVLPDLTETSKDDESVTQVHYPHFSTTELHHDFVDCITFYHDLILSRASKENRILLWKIDGFSSRDPVPSPAAAPTSSQLSETRSAFGGTFQRLLQFGAPHTNLFYMRFGLFHQPHKHPVLAIGNEKSRFLFWDLQRLEEGIDAQSGGGDDVSVVGTPAGGPGTGLRPPPFRHHHHHQQGRRDRGVLGSLAREPSVASEASSGVGSSTTSGSAVGLAAVAGASGGGGGGGAGGGGGGGGERRDGIDDPFTSVAAHKRITVPKIAFATRQIAWSPGGEWAVAVGDHGMVVLFRRWD
ncbi:MAG: hypothetical protein M1822_005118 [Bathelium mastoideum]|nr:MAG: hypothetical protein M1822_005118 [Bathelium mastoideum]